MIKVIATDLDGTLLNSKGNIGEFTIRELNEFANVGGIIILVSGRHFYQIVDYIEQFDKRENIFIIACDGIYIYNSNREILYQSDLLSFEDIKNVFRLTKCKSIIAFSDRNDFFIFDSFMEYIFCILKQFLKKTNVRKKIIYAKQLDYLKNDEIEKIVIKSTKHTTEYSKIFFDNYSAQISKNGNLELMYRNVNKYKAIEILADILDIDLSSILYFGNDYNDIECFKKLKYTVAVSNSINEIKCLASSLTLSNDENGVGVALNKYRKNGYVI